MQALHSACSSAIGPEVPEGPPDVLMSRLYTVPCWLVWARSGGISHKNHQDSLKTSCFQHDRYFSGQTAMLADSKRAYSGNMGTGEDLCWRYIMCRHGPHMTRERSIAAWYVNLCRVPRVFL